MQTAIAAIFVFLLVIILHELGHFTVAKLVGIKVNEFSIGMGPKLIQTAKGETKYTLRILPIGGYVQMEGEDEDSDDPRGFGKASPLARMAVIVAGAIMNFVLAIVVLSIVFYNIGVPTTTIDKFTENSPAEDAGILSGDKIIAINDNKIENWEELSESIASSNPDEQIKIQLLRNNQEKTIYTSPILEDGDYMIGIVPEHKSSFIYGIKSGIQETGNMIKIMFEFLGMLFKGQVTTEHLSGPVGIVREVGEAAKMGINTLLLILGFISVNLGVFNLLPIPALDGSRLVFILIELIRGKPIDPEKENIIHLIGIMLLFGLMIFVTYKDIVKLIL